MWFIEWLQKRSARKSEKRISYIKKIYARRGVLSSVMGIFSAAALISSVVRAYYADGNSDLTTAALCFCSVLISFTGLGFGLGAFFERDRNYFYAKLGILIHGLLLAAIVAVIALSWR